MNAPLILSGNIFENVILNPSYVVSNFNVDDQAGHEIFHVADNLRDMTYWTPATANSARSLSASAGISATIAPNMVVLDRGHNLAGKTITITSYAVTFSGGNFYYTQTNQISCTIPTVPGGLPSYPGGCLTPDGIWWKTFAIAAAGAWSLDIPALGAGIFPIVTGLYMGTSYQFPEPMNTPYSDDFDTDVQIQTNQLSLGGLRVMSRRLNFRKFVLNIDLEGTEYAPFDLQVRPLLRYGQPWWVCFDATDTTHAGMIAPFQLGGNIRYQPQANPVHREIRSVELEEVLPVLYT